MRHEFQSPDIHSTWRIWLKLFGTILPANKHNYKHLIFEWRPCNRSVFNCVVYVQCTLLWLLPHTPPTLPQLRKIPRSAGAVVRLTCMRCLCVRDKTPLPRRPLLPPSDSCIQHSSRLVRWREREPISRRKRATRRTEPTEVWQTIEDSAHSQVPISAQMPKMYS